MSRVAQVKKFSIENGEGIRTSIFFSGCEHNCKGCFNQEIWDFNIGNLFCREFYEYRIKPTINEHISGISILGGEPFHPQNIRATYLLASWFKEDFPDKDIWVWTGYTWGELISEKYELALNMLDYINNINIETLKKIDVLVDGRFIEEQKDLTLKWKGSKNQRVIDVKKTLEQSKVVVYKETEKKGN